MGYGVLHDLPQYEIKRGAQLRSLAGVLGPEYDRAVYRNAVGFF
jgi:hypothetical protein